MFKAISAYIVGPWISLLHHHIQCLISISIYIIVLIVPHSESWGTRIPSQAQERPMEPFDLTGGICTTLKGAATCGTMVWSLRPLLLSVLPHIPSRNVALVVRVRRYQPPVVL